MFVIVVLLIVPVMLVVGRLDQRIELLMTTLAIVVLGVPHGALDVALAQRLHHIRTPRGWALFGLSYVAPMIGVIAVWHWFPIGFLISFLVISAVHFSGDPEDGAALLTRFLYGGAPVVLPTLLHAPEVTTLFAMLTTSEAARQVSGLLAAISGLWLLGLFVAAGVEARRDRLCALEIAAVTLACLVAPPLIGFALFFCGMHSARHILRTAERLNAAPLQLMLRAALLPMTTTLAVAGGGWLLIQDLSIGEQVVRLLFVGLAALTVPHMILVDGPRLLQEKSK